MQPRKILALIDAQNLYHAIKRTFLPEGETPHYDERALIRQVCFNLRALLGDTAAWSESVYLYNVMPDQYHDSEAHGHWQKKITHLADKRWIVVPEISDKSALLLELAMELCFQTVSRTYDIALIFSQNSSLTRAVVLAKLILRSQKRPTDLLYSVYPEGPDAREVFPGMDYVTWYPFNRSDYESSRHSRNP